jgi:hypothetical protein
VPRSAVDHARIRFMLLIADFGSDPVQIEALLWGG